MSSIWRLRFRGKNRIRCFKSFLELIIYLKQNKFSAKVHLFARSINVARSIYFHIIILVFSCEPMSNRMSNLESVPVGVIWRKRFIIKISGSNARFSHVHISVLTFHFWLISNCILNLTVLRKKPIMKWIYTNSLNRRLYSLDGSLKSFVSLFLFITSNAKFLDRLEISVMIIQGIGFNLDVKQYQILRDTFFGKTELSFNFQVNKWTFQVQKIVVGEGMASLPSPSSYALD